MSNAINILREFADGSWSYQDAMAALLRRGWSARAARLALARAVVDQESAAA